MFVVIYPSYNRHSLSSMVGEDKITVFFGKTYPIKAENYRFTYISPLRLPMARSPEEELRGTARYGI